MDTNNLSHKLAVGLTGCVAAKAKDESCQAAAVGAIIGEMVGDWHTDNPNTLTQDEKEKLINQAKLIAGITAAYAGEDVNVAADMAAEAVRWNAASAAAQGQGPFNRRQQECAELGISTSDCGKYHGEKNLETLRQIGLFIIPTTPEEIAIAVVTGGAGRYVIKAGGKILSKTFESEEAAEKVLAEAKRASRADTRAGYEPDNDLLSSPVSGRREYYNFNLMSKTEAEEIATKISVRSPIKVPHNATTKIEQKAAGYAQIKYTWVKDGVKYESRWHTRTPSAPANQTNSWVVTRKIQGSRTQKAGDAEYLLSNGQWVSESKWNNALKLRKQGKETKESREILDKGHIKDVE